VKGKRFSEERITGVLKKAEAGVRTNEPCQRHGITEQTYYRWKSGYGGLEVSEMKGCGSVRTRIEFPSTC